MTLDQMFELAKLGKTPAEIKEFMELEKATEQPEEQTVTTQKDAEQPESGKAEEKTPEAAADPAPEDKTAELQKQIDDLKKQLAEAQKNNAKQNLDDLSKQTAEDILNDIVRGFM